MPNKGKRSLFSWGWEGVPLNLMCLRTCTDKRWGSDSLTENRQVLLGDRSISFAARKLASGGTDTGLLQ